MNGRPNRQATHRKLSFAEGPRPMLTISKPLSAGQARRYHAEEFQNARENYYTEGDEIRGEWHGQLAREWGLSGEVRRGALPATRRGPTPDHRRGARPPSDGRTARRMPTGKPRRRWSTAPAGTRRSRRRRACRSPRWWAATSASARRTRERACRARLRPSSTSKARLGGNHPAETTGNWVAAKFEHDSARPVDGYAAPQLHTHVVFFNLTETDDRRDPPAATARALQDTAIRHGRLPHRSWPRGSRTWDTRSSAGRTASQKSRATRAEYLEASSPRRQQIEDHLAKEQQTGAAAAQIAAHQHARTEARSLT